MVKKLEKLTLKEEYFKQIICHCYCLAYHWSVIHGIPKIIVYVKTPTDTESLLNTMRIFSKDIQMKFVLCKCAALSLSINYGKIQKLDGIKLKNCDIKLLSSDDNYKYIEILEADNLQHTKVKTEQ